MFDPITLPFGAKMLFNTVTLKPGVTFEEVELAVGEMCNVVKETYGGDKGGFIAGQVFKFSGFVSDQGSLNASRSADYRSTRSPIPSRAGWAASRRVNCARPIGALPSGCAMPGVATRTSRPPLPPRYTGSRSGSW